MRRFLEENSLSLVFGGLFLATLVGQAFAGWHLLNDELFAEGLHQISFGRYLTSASFAVDVTENWQSEYLQFLLYVVFTVWLLQRGSPESKELQQPDGEHDVEQELEILALPVLRHVPREGRRGQISAEGDLVETVGELLVVDLLPAGEPLPGERSQEEQPEDEAERVLGEEPAHGCLPHACRRARTSV